MRNSILKSSNYKWYVFFAMATGSLTNVIHHGAVSIALPTLAKEFDVSLTIIQWVVLAEALTISSMLLPMGKLSDTIGRKPMYLLGCLFFGLMSLCSGSSTYIAAIIGISSPIFIMIPFRVLQGFAGAMIQANGMAIVTSVFPDNERGKGLGAHGSIIGTGGVLGPIIGGFLITYASWNWIFWINAPLCLLTISATSYVLTSKQFNKTNLKSAKFDWVGATLSTLILLSLLVTLSNGSSVGWSSLSIIAGFIVFLISLIFFIFWELKFSNPMLDLSLFKSPALSVGVGSNFLSFLGISSFRFIIPFFLQAALKYSPAQVSLILVPNAVARILLGPFTGTLSDKYGIKIFTTSGLVLSGIGLILLGFMHESTSFLNLMTYIMIFSFGSAIFMPPNQASIFSSSLKNNHGVVSALVNLSRNSGNVSGIAIATAIVAATMLSFGFSSDVEPVINANEGSDLLSSFILGMKYVFITMGIIQFIGAIAHFRVKKII